MLDLLDRRQKCHIGFDKSCHKLSQVEVTILCILLEFCIKPSTTTVGDLEVLDPVLKALQVSDVLSGDPAILKPCMTVLGDLSNSFYASLKTETQDLVFRHLVLLFRSANGDIQKATREALLRINITCSIVSRILDFICEQKVWSNGSKHEKKRKKRSACNNRDVCLDIIPGGGNVVAFVGSLLDVLLLKKDMENRGSLIVPCSSFFKMPLLIMSGFMRLPTRVIYIIILHLETLKSLLMPLFTSNKSCSLSWKTLLLVSHLRIKIL